MGSKNDPRRLILRDPEAAALAATGRVEVWRKMKRQPDPAYVDAVVIRDETPGHDGWFARFSYSDGGATQCWECDCPWRPGAAYWVAEAFLPCKLPGYGFAVASEAGYVCFRDGGQKFRDGGKYYPHPESIGKPDPASWPQWAKWSPAGRMPRWASRAIVACRRVAVERRGEAWGWVGEFERSET